MARPSASLIKSMRASEMACRMKTSICHRETLAHKDQDLCISVSIGVRISALSAKQESSFVLWASLQKLQHGGSLHLSSEGESRYKTSPQPSGTRIS